MSTTQSAIKVDIREHIAHVVISNPEKRNALNLKLINELCEAADRIEQDRSIRAVMLYGQGDDFSTGLDTSLFSDPGAIRYLLSTPEGHDATHVQLATLKWRCLSVPVIAAVKGNAIGAGLQLAIAADIRVGSMMSQFSFAEVNWGLIPDMAISETLLPRLSDSHARLLMMTGEKVNAQYALDVGLLTVLDDDPLQRAQHIAESIVAKSPDAVRAIKSLLNRSSHMSVNESLILEGDLQRGLLAGNNLHEAMSSQIERRKAKYELPPEQPMELKKL